MRDGLRADKTSGTGWMRAALLGGAATLALLSSQAQAAQSHLPAAPKRAPSPAMVGDDGLGHDNVYLEADEIVRDDKNQTVVAKGAVEARYQGRTLRAQEVDYDQTTGVITAKGDVQVINADGTAQFAEEMTLDDQMRAGVALSFSARLDQNMKLASATAIRRNENVSELTRAIYTPCDICAADGKAKEPSWSIQADKIIQDHEHQVIYYRHAVIRVLGVPLLYAPVFWHPDPSADRSSGFLPPKIQPYSNRRGFSYEQPYYWAISPSQDLIISPQLNMKVNPLLNLEYRKRFYSGEIDVRAGYTYEAEFGTPGGNFTRIGDVTSRSYILAKGKFEINKLWSWGFTAERVTDYTFFDRYSVHQVYEDRGAYATDDHRLLSQLYTTRQDSNSFLSISTLGFQGLRPSDKLSTYTYNDHTFPVVAPLIEAHYEPETKILGGRLRFLGSAVALSRDAVLMPAATDTANPTTNSRRASGQVDWRGGLTFDNGMRVEPFASLRGDYYNVDEVTNVATKITVNRSVGRSISVVGADFTWPFIKQQGATTIVLEPIAQVALSPNVKRNNNIPNEDSQSFQFDETNLFDVNRFSGYDLYEGGQRFNVGGRATATWSGGRSARLLIGRSFRAQSNTNFLVSSGLRGTSSDWIVAADVTPIAQLSLFAHSRLDGDTAEVRRLDLGGNFNISKLHGFVRYQKQNTNVTNLPITQAVSAGLLSETLDMSGEFFVTKHWGGVFFGQAGRYGYDPAANLTDKSWRWRRSDFGVMYTDECVRVEVIYQREEAVATTLGPSSTVLLRLTLATLGDAGYRNYDYR